MDNSLTTFDSSRSNDDLSDEVIPRSSLDDDCLAPFLFLTWPVEQSESNSTRNAHELIWGGAVSR